MSPKTRAERGLLLIIISSCAFAAGGCEFSLKYGDGDDEREGERIVAKDSGVAIDDQRLPKQSDALPPPTADSGLGKADTLVSGVDSGITDGPCAQLSCTAPPAPRCTNTATLLRYDTLGTCVSGACVYASKSETCAGSCLAGSCLAAQTMIHVDANNAGSQTGTAKAPYRSIGAALTATSSSSAVAILVAQGNYAENVVITNRVVELIGGYPGASAAAYVSGAGGNFSSRDPSQLKTTINAPSGTTLALSNASTSLVTGFVITGGGRGVSCQGGSPTVSDNRITHNDIGPLTGGGVYATDCDLKLLDNVIAHNVGGRGAGVATQRGTVLIEGNVIQDNNGIDNHGGGLYLVSGKITLRNNLIKDNRIGLTMGYGWGGGVCLVDARADLIGNVVTGNHAASLGSGVFVDDGSEATLQNELYFANRCYEGGAGLLVDGLNASVFSKATLINVTIADHACAHGLGQGLMILESNVTMRNTILWNNGAQETFVSKSGTLAASYSNSPQPLPGVGNISADPRFAKSGPAPYHLRSKVGRWDGSKWVVDSVDSPCLDAGDVASGVGQEPSPNGGRANMGAYGRTALASKSL